MSVLKEDGTRRLIQQILASLRVGKIAIMDKVLSTTSSNPVENKVITGAINNILDGGVFGDIVTFEEDVEVQPNNVEVAVFEQSMEGYSGFAILDFSQRIGVDDDWYHGNVYELASQSMLPSNYPVVRDYIDSNNVLVLRMNVCNTLETTQTIHTRIKVLLYK